MAHKQFKKEKKNQLVYKPALVYTYRALFSTAQFRVLRTFDAMPLTSRQDRLPFTTAAWQLLRIETATLSLESPRQDII